ncbi:MAG: DUF5916 domain-containing protein [Gemmatimonadota bacterium]
MNRSLVSIFLAGALSIAGARAAAAQNSTGGNAATSRSAGAGFVAQASATQVAPVIDGRLGDAPWADALPLTDFVQREPRDGEASSERTEVRILYDDEALYVGVWAFDSRPEGIVPGDRIRDYELEESDAVVLVLDTFRDQVNGFVFGTTPSGIEYDGQVANEGQGGGFFLGGGAGNNQRRFQAGAGGGFNKNWDGSWTVATSTDAQGWYAEFRIPFSTLRYGSEAPSWGFNVMRRIRRKNEEAFWTRVPREFNLYRLNYAGELQGLEPPFRRLASVTPYVLGSTAKDYEAGDTEFGSGYEWGGEAKVQVTQGLTLDLTANTDFAQVEVDDQQVNLTRFSLLFPEKRPFFLENAGFFTVGGGGADLFFSRRIGISSGQPVPILGGARLSGKTAGLNVGLLHIQTDGLEDVQPATAYSVARLARELPNRSRIGGLFADRNSDFDGDDNRTYALDAQVGIGQALTLSGWAARTDTPEDLDAEQAWNLNAGWSSRSWTGSLQAQEFGENFDPGVGFASRVGHRYYQAFAMHYVRPRRIFRELRPHVSYFTYRSRKDGIERGFEETSRLHVDSHFEWASGMMFSPAMNWSREGLYEPFQIADSVVVQPGVYEGWEAAWRFNTNRSARVVLDAGIDWGTFLSGTRHGWNMAVTLRQGEALTTSFRYAENDLDLAEGRFKTRLGGMNVGYFFTPRIYVQSLLQYSDQADRWSTNVRFGWLNTAGTGLFIVYNDVQGIDDLSGPLGRSLILKFTRQFNVMGG